VISTLAHFHFIRPTWLLLLPLAVWLWWRWQHYADPLRGWREQISPELFEFLIAGKKSRYQQPATWLLIVWLISIVAIAGPTWRLEPSPFAEDATPLMIVLKADSSMEQPDPAPSRLEHARLKIADLAETRKGQPLGLIAYAGSAHLVLPPTRDTAIVARMAGEISPAIMPTPGDRLDLAIGEAARILTEGQQGGSIAVLADTVDTDPRMLNMVQAETAVPIQFLALNSSGSSPDQTLLSAADILNANVEPLTIDGGDIAAIIRRSAGRSLPAEDELSNQWHEAGYWLVPIVCLLLLGGFRREKREGEA
jgi:Ca-activated chloride channel family protein